MDPDTEEFVNHYDVLGVSRNATPEIIETLFKARRKQLHPDHGGDEEELKRVTQARNILIDQERRQKFDEELRAHEAAAGEGAASGPDPTGPDAAGEDFGDSWGQEEEWAPGETAVDPEDFTRSDPRVLAGFDVWKPMPYTAEQVPWLQDLPAAQAEYTPATAPPPAPTKEQTAARSTGTQRVLWTCTLGLALLAYVVVSSLGGVGLFGFGAVFGALAFGLPRALGGPGIFPRIWAYVYYLFCAAALFLSLLTTSGYGDTRLALIEDSGMRTTNVVVLVVVAVLYGVAVRSWHRARRFAHVRQQSQAAQSMQDQPGLISPDEVERFRQWGDPGRHLNTADTPFTERNRDLGFGGEILTSELIDVLVRIPSVRAVHGILLPGHGDADIDHVLLCGDLLIPVDSKNWSGGDYYWLSNQIMSTTPSGLQRRGNPMEWALGPLQQMFPHKYLVPVIVVHSHDGVPVNTNNQGRGRNPMLMTGQQFVEQIGRMCLDQHATTVDRQALTALRNMMA